ncbi:hypothetical protein ABZV34_15995 [Streptomyces sp. NPDC005195]
MPRTTGAVAPRDRGTGGPGGVQGGEGAVDESVELAAERGVVPYRLSL